MNSPVNDKLFKCLNDLVLEKRVIDAVNEFMRAKIREDGFYKIMSPTMISLNDVTMKVNPPIVEPTLLEAYREAMKTNKKLPGRDSRSIRS